MSSDLAFAEFIDSCLQRFPRQRKHFLDELPVAYECPSNHKHGETGTCYIHHHCRCEQCRRAMGLWRSGNRYYKARAS